MQPTVGIDFGTSFAYTAVMDGPSPATVPTAEGGKALPALVAVAQNGRRLVGSPAQNVALTNAENTVHGVKRLLGHRASSGAARTIAAMVPFRMARSGEDEVFIKLPGWNARPVEIGAMILAEQRQQATQYLDQQVYEAVLSVPSYFTAAQTAAMIEAARLAGFRDVSTIEDPVAPARAYGHNDRPGTIVAVYHLGGGTFEVSLLSIGAVTTEVVDTAGDAFLGGETIDDSIMEWFVSRCRVQYGVDLTHNTLALQSLRPAVQLAKRRLSEREEAEIVLPFTKGGQTRDLRFTLDRAELEQMTRPLLKRTLEITSGMLRRAGILVDGISAVLLVGGQTRMPLVQHEVGRFFGRAPSLAPAPEEVIALGACMGASAGGGDDELELAYY